MNEWFQELRGLIEKRDSGEMTEDEFRPLRLMNGLYLQLHAYMLRVAVPYGVLKGHLTSRINVRPPSF